MTRDEIAGWMNDFTQSSALNVVPELQNMRIFDVPLTGIADADDPLFERLKSETAVGAVHLSPREWLPEGQAVLSFFLPFSEAVRVANRTPGDPATEWLYGRIEGHHFVNALARHLVDNLSGAGVAALAPTLDDRFAVINRRSNWSERHVAFVAGLGTLSLNRSLITRAGAAGRLGSLVVAAPLVATQRDYVEREEYCTHCGACIRRCPPEAITLEGKDHARCSAYLDETLERFSPRYGCGKCQTGVPCEAGIPGK